MILLKLELHSARTGKVTELGRMHITNDGTGTVRMCHYIVETIRKGSHLVNRRSRVENHARQSLSVWVLVRRALQAMGY